jgi:hypothetical protein
MSIRSKRKEPFRYLFKDRTECTFQILEINGKQISAKPAIAAILDISKSGCKLHTNLNLNCPANHIKLVVDLIVDERNLRFGGSVRWQMQVETSYTYGVQLELIESEKDNMLIEIRGLAAKKKIGVF